MHDYIVVRKILNVNAFFRFLRIYFEGIERAVSVVGDNKMGVIERILKLISQKGITEQKFLSDLHLNRTLLSDWKSGKSKSYRKHIAEIAEYFGVSTDYLLTGSKTASLSPNDDVPEEFVLMARKTGDIPIEKRKQLYKFLNSTIDTFLEALDDEKADK